MATTSNRAPLLLALLLVLGVGGRWLRDAGGTPKDSPVASAALDAQLAQADQRGEDERAGKGSGGRRSETAKDGRPSRERRKAEPRAKRPPARKRTGGQERREGTRTRQGDGDGVGAAAQPGAGSVREERTPLAVVAPEALRRYRADQRVLARATDREPRDRSTTATARRAARAAARSPVDVEAASAAELERLPRVGPALAQRIVSDRSANGPFRSLEGLQRVPGIGPALARQLQGYVTFGGTGRP